MESEKFSVNQSDSVDGECRQVLLSSALAIGIITGLTFLTTLIVSSFISSPSLLDLADFPEFTAKLVRPEPTERMVFQLMLVLSPFIAFLSHLIVRRISPSSVSSLFYGSWGYAVVATLMLVWINSWAFLPNYMLSSGLGSFSIILPITSGLLMLAYAYSSAAPLRWIDALIKKRFVPALAIVLGICLPISISYRIFNWKILAMCSEYPLYHYKNPVLHINPVLYYISLAETGNYSTPFGAPQYGFYSLYLKPVFSLLGLTLYSFSFVMTLLYLLGAVAIAVPIFRHMKNIYLKLLLVPALCAIQGSLSQVSDHWDPYYQYYPIRLLVPALSVLMLYLILRTEKQETRLYLVGLSSFGLGFLVFWNLDSGITTIIAWLGFFLLFALVEIVKRQAFINRASALFFLGIAMLAFGVGTAAAILIICNRTSFSFSHMFEVQRIFYLKGVMMLPMPLYLHPWMAVLGAYVATLVLTLPSIFRTGISCSPKRMLAFYIAILGFGLFAYYQGRSHDMAMPAVIWPAILCCFLACDWCLSAPPTERRSAISFLAMPFVILCVSLTLKLLWNSPWYFNRMILLHETVMTTELNSKTMPVSYTIDWLSEYRNEPPGSVFIIHQAESIFYVESGLHPSPLLPSEQERSFFRYQEADTQKILQSGTVKHIFISPILPKTPEYKRICETIRPRYELDKALLLEHWTLKE